MRALRCAAWTNNPNRGCNADAAVGATGTSRHLRLRIRAAQRLHRLAVRGIVGPWRTPPPRHGLGAPGAVHGGSSARSPDRAPDMGLRPLERPYLRPFIPGFSVCRGAAPSLARTPSVYAPALSAALALCRARRLPSTRRSSLGRRTAMPLQTVIDWQFRTADACLRLKKPYPVIET